MFLRRIKKPGRLAATLNPSLQFLHSQLSHLDLLSVAGLDPNPAVHAKMSVWSVPHRVLGVCSLLTPAC